MACATQLTYLGFPISGGTASLDWGVPAHCNVWLAVRRPELRPQA